jgi:hypothetical protein
VTNNSDQQPEGPGRDARAKRWAVVRIVLGNLQMFGATAGIVLLALTGMNPVTVTVFAITAALTVTSLLVFRDPPRWLGGPRG